MDGDTKPINDPNHDGISDFSKATRENTGLFGIPTVFETTVSQSQESMPRETVARQREREEREGSVITGAESMSRKSRQNSTWNHSLQTHRKLFSDGRELENTWNEELNKLFLVKIQIRDNCTRLSTRWRSTIWSEEIKNTHYSSHSVSLNLKDDNCWKPIRAPGMLRKKLPRN